MSSAELDNLVRIGHLKREPARVGEVAGLMTSGSIRLADSRGTRLSLESRFDLAYNAAHALALAALRRLELRPANRYIVFQAEVVECDAHRRRQTGRVHTLALDTIEPAPAAENQIDLRALMSRPERRLGVNGKRPAPTARPPSSAGPSPPSSGSPGGGGVPRQCGGTRAG